MAYRIRPEKSFTDEVRSAATEQLQGAIIDLSERPDGLHEAIHDARKKFKRLRALYRLIADDARHFRKQENARVREMARTLSVVRDATALIETTQHFATVVSSAEQRKVLKVLKSALTKRRDRLAADETDLEDKVAAAIAVCHEALDAISGLSLADRPRKAASTLRKGWLRMRAGAEAAVSLCQGEAHVEHFHELRKRSQDHWMYSQLLRDVWPSAMRAKQAETKRLVDLLGYQNDLAVLSALLNEDRALVDTSENLAHVLAIINSCQQSLREEALERAERVFAGDAEQEARIVGVLWTVGAK
ncbi:CHAD domain-containing protein [Rhizobium sp. BK251]|uniref:CHAD domain-containing protein n=1 Tax=Rhizobium sp. BK251 TaxID=2512125 RepID=UPI00104B91FC|nr:CHAD domain-containing protein [Rhizobium sp. BK251]TCL69600.1 CHAD domain-containing protein [Rhizobium sp. BK251]